MLIEWTVDDGTNREEVAKHTVEINDWEIKNCKNEEELEDLFSVHVCSAFDQTVYYCFEVPEKALELIEGRQNDD
ncbi:MAG: hypothetical protein DRH90_16700 [Deltaproteobacteria bacterium]|nr:MAG: hypothetical protein DRH90_16700 [Deltaproteobacteria bacterium]RLC18220.1 MAG: hypothetical protein DRI24_03765 [Deltaproteobacteria bacterium]